MQGRRFPASVGAAGPDLLAVSWPEASRNAANVRASVLGTPAEPPGPERERWELLRPESCRPQTLLLTPPWPHWLSAGPFVLGGANEQWALAASQANQSRVPALGRAGCCLRAPAGLTQSRTPQREKKAIRQLEAQPGEDPTSHCCFSLFRADKSRGGGRGGVGREESEAGLRDEAEFTEGMTGEGQERRMFREEE